MERTCHAIAAIACAVALAVALQTVDGLRWPYDGDHYRDVAQAQVTLDGHPLSDPFYAGEWIWYNPLLPWLVALGSAAAHVTPAVFHVQGGPWLNLIGPIGFYLLAARLAGHGAALAALVIFLFFNCGNEPSLTCPTYSPWLFVATFAQGLFYLTLLAMLWTARQETLAWSAMAGLLMGLTFLTHTAPVIVLAAAAPALLAPRLLAVAGTTALVVASPFLYSIVGHYHLRVVNEAPLAWRYLPVTVAGFPQVLAANAVLIAAGIVGAVMLRQTAARLWLGISLGLTMYGLSRDLAPGLPALVPTFHFWRYAVAALTLFAGVTVWRICARLAGRRAVVALAALAIVAISLNLSRYTSRFDFVYGRAIAEQRNRMHAAVTAYLRRTTTLEDVVLGSRGVALQIIGPAGRKTVAVNPFWSNPYVENAGRVRDREQMFAALKAGDRELFTQLASRYRVTYVIGTGDADCRDISGSSLMPTYRSGDVCIFKVANAEH